MSFTCICSSIDDTTFVTSYSNSTHAKTSKTYFSLHSDQVSMLFQVSHLKNLTKTIRKQQNNKKYNTPKPKTTKIAQHIIWIICTIVYHPKVFRTWQVVDEFRVSATKKIPFVSTQFHQQLLHLIWHLNCNDTSNLILMTLSV